VRTADGGLELEYDRIARHASEIPMRLLITSRPVRDTIVDLWISNEFLDGVVIERIEPEPIESRAGDRGQVFRFRIADPSRSADVMIHLEPDELWRRNGAIGLVGGDSLRFRQFVLP
jgi:hypothetical protein